MFKGFLHLHIFIWWIIVLTGLWSVVRAWRGRLSAAAWSKADKLFGLAFSSALATQFLIGLALYSVSPTVRPVFDAAAAPVARGELHFFAFLHPLAMLTAVVLAQVGFSVSKRMSGDARKFQWAVICYTTALLLVLLATPWPGLGLPWGRSLVP